MDQRSIPMDRFSRHMLEGYALLMDSLDSESSTGERAWRIMMQWISASPGHIQDDGPATFTRKTAQDTCISLTEVHNAMVFRCRWL